MRRRWLIDLVLLFVVAGLGLLIWATERDARRDARLTALHPEAIDEIRLERGDQSTLLRRRDDAHWDMASPYEVAADADQVSRLLPIAAAASHRVLPVSAVDLAALGLDPPMVAVRLDDLLLAVGGTEPIDERRYVRVGDLVHLIDDRFIGRLLAPAEDYVDRSLLPPDFSPGIGSLNGRPMSADDLAVLAESVAERVEPLGQALTGVPLSIQSADADSPLRFLVSDAGRRWSRLDLRLSWVFATSPLPALDTGESARPQGDADQAVVQ